MSEVSQLAMSFICNTISYTRNTYSHTQSVNKLIMVHTCWNTYSRKCLLPCIFFLESVLLVHCSSTFFFFSPQLQACSSHAYKCCRLLHLLVNKIAELSMMPSKFLTGRQHVTLFNCCLRPGLTETAKVIHKTIKHCSSFKIFQDLTIVLGPYL